MAVNGYDHPVGHASRFGDRTQVAFNVGRPGFCISREWFTANETPAKKGQFGVVRRSNFLVAEEVLAIALGRTSEAKFTAEPLEFPEALRVDGMRHLMAERIDAGTAGHIVPLLTRDMPGAVGTRNRHERNAALRSVEVGRRGGRGEIGAGTCMGNSGVVEMRQCGEQPCFAKVEHVVVRAGHDIDAEPFQFREIPRGRRHIGRDGNIRTALVRLSHGAFEVTKRGVGIGQEIAQGQEAGLGEHAQAARQHDIACKRERQRTAFGVVEHC